MNICSRCNRQVTVSGQNNETKFLPLFDGKIEWCPNIGM